MYQDKSQIREKLMLKTLEESINILNDIESPIDAFASILDNNSLESGYSMEKLS